MEDRETESDRFIIRLRNDVVSGISWRGLRDTLSLREFPDERILKASPPELKRAIASFEDLGSLPTLRLEQELLLEDDARVWRSFEIANVKSIAPVDHIKVNYDIEFARGLRKLPLLRFWPLASNSPTRTTQMIDVSTLLPVYPELDRRQEVLIEFERKSVAVLARPTDCLVSYSTDKLNGFLLSVVPTRSRIRFGGHLMVSPEQSRKHGLGTYVLSKNLRSAAAAAVIGPAWDELPTQSGSTSVRTSNMILVEEDLKFDMPTGIEEGLARILSSSFFIYFLEKPPRGKLELLLSYLRLNDSTVSSILVFDNDAKTNSRASYPARRDFPPLPSTVDLSERAIPDSDGAIETTLFEIMRSEKELLDSLKLPVKPTTSVFVDLPTPIINLTMPREIYYPLLLLGRLRGTTRVDPKIGWQQVVEKCWPWVPFQENDLVTVGTEIATRTFVDQAVTMILQRLIPMFDTERDEPSPESSNLVSLVEALDHFLETQSSLTKSEIVTLRRVSQMIRNKESRSNAYSMLWKAAYELTQNSKMISLWPAVIVVAGEQDFSTLDRIMTLASVKAIQPEGILPLLIVPLPDVAYRRLMEMSSSLMRGNSSGVNWFDYSRDLTKATPRSVIKFIERIRPRHILAFADVPFEYLLVGDLGPLGYLLPYSRLPLSQPALESYHHNLALCNFPRSNFYRILIVAPTYFDTARCEVCHRQVHFSSHLKTPDDLAVYVSHVLKSEFSKSLDEGRISCPADGGRIINSKSAVEINRMIRRTRGFLEDWLTKVVGYNRDVTIEKLYDLDASASNVRSRLEVHMPSDQSFSMMFYVGHGSDTGLILPADGGRVEEYWRQNASDSIRARWRF